MPFVNSAVFVWTPEREQGPVDKRLVISLYVFTVCIFAELCEAVFGAMRRGCNGPVNNLAKKGVGIFTWYR